MLDGSTVHIKHSLSSVLGSGDITVSDNIKEWDRDLRCQRFCQKVIKSEVLTIGAGH